MLRVGMSFLYGNCSHVWGVKVNIEFLLATHCCRANLQGIPLLPCGIPASPCGWSEYGFNMSLVSCCLYMFSGFLTCHRPAPKKCCGIKTKANPATFLCGVKYQADLRHETCSYTCQRASSKHELLSGSTHAASSLACHCSASLCCCALTRMAQTRFIGGTCSKV